jgi:hypothetical protein
MTCSPRALNALLWLASAMSAGCSSANDNIGMSTASITLPSSTAETAKPNALSRPLALAWTSARAKRCGFSFDPDKLRTLYLAYEAKQGAAGEAYARIEKKVSNDPNYCTEQKQRQIKVELERHLIGDFSPNLPPSKVEAACKSWFGCASDTSDEPFDSNKFWREKEGEPKPW